MLISVVMPKGGNGKTTLANAISRSLSGYYATNDPINSYLVVENHPNYISQITEAHTEDNAVIFDAGGFIDKKIKDVVSASDMVIIPIEFSNSAVMSLHQVIDELKELSDNIHVVINKVKKPKHYNDLHKVLTGIGITNIYSIRNSVDMWETLLEQNKSVEEFYNDPVMKNRYKEGIYNDYFAVLQAVRNQYIKLHPPVSQADR